MKRFLAFMFGIIFGVVFLLGSVGIAMYTAVTVVHPNEIYADIENYLGDLGDVSLLQAYYNILDLYNDKTGNISDEKLYSVGDFLADNHISSQDADGNTVAFGVVMPKELLDAPLFEYFNTNVDEEGNTGVHRALKQIKLSAVPSIVNTFATPDESGNPVVSDEIVAKLDEHSVYDLVFGGEKTEDGQVDIVANLAVVLDEITLADLIPAFRPEGQTDNLLKNLFLALGQSPIGPIISDLTGDANILGMLNDDGSLSAVGKLTIADIVGDSDPLIDALVGDIALYDLVNEQGELVIVDALDKVSIAGLVGVIKRTADVTIEDANITTFYETKDDGTQGALIFSVGTVGGKYYISMNAENDSVETTWYEGQLVCTEGHTHVADCYDYNWYALCSEEHAHDGEFVVNTEGGAVYYAPIALTSVKYTLAKLSLSYLFDETGAINLNNLLAQFDQHSVEQILKELLAHNEILDQICELLKLDGVKITDLLAEGGLDKLLDGAMDAPLVDVLGAFGLTDLGMIADIVGDMSINELIAGGYNNISLGGLIGLVKRDLTSDIVDTNGQLASGVVSRDFTTTIEEQTVVELSVAYRIVGEETLYYISTNYDKSADTSAPDYTPATWYEARLKCADGSHTAFDNHNKDCFEYSLYQACTNEDTTHDHATEDAFSITKTVDEVDTTTYYVPANSLFATLGNMTIGGIMEGGLDTLFEELTNIKLADLFEMLGLAEVEGALEALAELTIKELMEGGYNNIYLGGLLGYTRNELTAVDESSIVTHKDTADNVVGYTATAGSQIAISADGEIWYVGELVCKETHTHAFDCYQNLWYQKCADGCTESHDHVTIDGANHTPASGLFAVLVDITIGDITTNPDSLLDKVFDIQLKDLFGGEMDGLMATIGEYSINDLMNPDTLNNLGIGDILSYIRKDVTSEISASEWVELVAGVKHNTVTDAYARLDGDKWYNAQFVCKKDGHPHDIDCYSYVWYTECTSTTCTEHDEHFDSDGKRYGNVGGLYGVLADLTIGNLTGGADIMEKLTNRLTIGDIFGDNIPEMLGSLKDTPIAELSGAIETTKVGDLLGYEYDETDARWEKDGAPLEGIEKILADKTIANLKDFDTILNDVTLGDVLNPVPEMLESLADVKIKDLGSKLEDMQVGKLLGYEYDETEARWEKDGAPLTGIEKILAGKKISDLKNFDTILDEVTLGDVLNPVPDMLKSLADVHIKDLGSELENMQVGELLGYEYDETESRWEKDGAPLTGIEKVLAGKKISELKDLNTIMDDVKLGDVLNPVPDMLASIADTPLSQISTAIDGIYVGEFLGYTKGAENGSTTLDCEESHPHTEDCYYANYNWLDGATPVSGVMAKLANKKVGNLNSIGDDITTYTFAEIMGTNAGDSALIKALYNTPVGNIGTEMNTIQLGTAMGYYRNEISAGVYETDANGKVVWYTDEACTPANKVGAPQSALVNSTLNTLDTDISTITLGELVDLDSDSSAMLKALKDTPINGIANAIDGMALGTAMGYARHEVAIGHYPVTVVDGVKATTADYATAQCAKLDGVIWYDAKLDCKESHTHTSDCFGYIWYQKCADGCAESHTHVTIDGANHSEVTGLNAKMSNLTVDGLGGTAVVDIVTDLSMKDMMESGILTFTEEEKYKLAVLFGCDETTHKTQYMSQDFGCNLGGYFGYNALYGSMNSGASVTVEEYYKLTHGITGDLTEEQLAHRDVWQNCTLTEFISALLASF